MSLNAKLAKIESILCTYYTNAGHTEPQISDSINKVMKLISSTGGVTESALSEITTDDLIGSVPILVARQIVRAIGGNNAEAKQIVIMSDDPISMAARLKPEQLVAEYDPNDPTNPFGTRLASLTKSQPCLVFQSGYNSSHNLDVVTSAKLVRELLDGFPPRKTIVIDGELQEIYAVGEAPAKYADENPAAPGTMLRPDGVSDNNVHWGNIQFSVQQLIYFAVKNGELANKSEHDIYDEVAGKDFNTVSCRLPKSTIEFKKFEGLQQLPPLKIVLSPKVKTK